MPVSRRVVCVVCIALGFVLIIAGGLVALYAVPAVRQVPGRVGLVALTVAGVLAGVFVILRFASRLEELSEPAHEDHIPGLDADVETTRKPPA